MLTDEPKVPVAGETLGRYVIEKKLAEGAFGVVYQGRDLRLGRSVAIKLLRRSGSRHGRAWEALLEEARTASALSHPNICAVYDVSEEGGRSFIAMEYVEGRTLREVVSGGGLAVAVALDYGVEIAGALVHAHQRGVIHRDLKSSNVMVTRDGRVKLLDFGLAWRISSEDLETMSRSRQPFADQGGLVGTLPYMAPEVLHGRETGVPSDVWAFGAMLYEMLTGSPPFRGQTPFELSMSIMSDPTPALPAGTSKGLQSIVRRALEKDCARRYPNAGEILRDLEAEHQRTGARLAGAGVTRAGWRRWTWRMVPVVLALGLVAGIRLERRAALKGPAGANRPAPVPTANAPPAVPPRATAPASGQHSAPRLAAVQHDARRKKIEGNPDVIVWLNQKSGIYHCPGSRWYRNTQRGATMTQRAAERQGFRPAAGKFCP